ncbi:O-antigen ligase family protein [Natronococcus sp.]|uniref:O-antigen ligase family protein n=1 Tax=Natronococcus sp. TaxID=35747 RepID=UPI003A4DA76E
MAKSAAAFVGAALVAAGLAPTTWLVDPAVGYVLSGTVLLSIFALGALSGLEDGRLTGASLERPIVALFALYWVGLVVQFGLTGSTSFVPYVLLTPLVCVTLWYVVPPLILERPRAFVGGLVGAVVALTLLGIALLVVETVTAANFPWTGNRVFGQPGLRVASIYGNPNAFGFAAAVASLGALWASLESRHRRWTAALLVTLAGLVLSDATMALLSFGAGTAALLFARSPKSGLAFAAVGALTASAVLLTDLGASYLALVIERGGSERLEFWQVALSRAAENPVLGAGFDAGIPTHNSFVAIALNAGYLVGGVYVLALVGTVASALRKARDDPSWNGFVLAALTLLAFQMLTESFTLGGLSTMSLLLATFVGLALVDPSETATIPLSRQFRERPDSGVDQ